MVAGKKLPSNAPAAQRAMARISIAPLWARFFDLGARRMPSFLTELAGDA
jgi:hypothetical protein